MLNAAKTSVMPFSPMASVIECRVMLNRPGPSWYWEIIHKHEISLARGLADSHSEADAQAAAEQQAQAQPHRQSEQSDNPVRPLRTARPRALRRAAIGTCRGVRRAIPMLSSSQGGRARHQYPAIRHRPW
jgi:hypothetical protein